MAKGGKTTTNDRANFKYLLQTCLKDICSLSEDQLEALYEHYIHLSRWNQRLNLTHIVDLETIVVRHYCESLFLGIHLPRDAASVIDIGSGAGFPGIPIAVLLPHVRVSLVESRQRKAVFLRDSTRNLPNVTVLNCRAQSIEGSFDFLVSRAVRWQEIFSLTPRLSQRIGILIGKRDVPYLTCVESISWQEPVCIPWSLHTALLMGEYVSRGTAVEHPRSTVPRET